VSRSNCGGRRIHYVNRLLCESASESFNMTDIRNLLSGEDGIRSACSGKVEIVSQEVLRKLLF